MVTAAVVRAPVVLVGVATVPAVPAVGDQVLHAPAPGGVEFPAALPPVGDPASPGLLTPSRGSLVEEVAAVEGAAATETTSIHSLERLSCKEDETTWFVVVNRHTVSKRFNIQQMANSNFTPE